MSWIKVRSNLIDHPKVVRIMSALCLPDVHILGALVRLWSIADQHADGEFLQSMTLDALDKKVGTPGLAQLLVEVGWLRVEATGLYLVNYQEHNGANAKRRASDAKRKFDVRNMSASRPQTVRTSGDQEKENKSKNKKKEKKEAEPAPDEIEFSFPCDGEPEVWHLTKPQVARWVQLYPKLDVIDECRKALAWVESNAANQKTAGGMTRFLNGWLGRATNRPTAPVQPVRQSFTPKPPTPSFTERLAAEQAAKTPAVSLFTLEAKNV